MSRVHITRRISLLLCSGLLCVLALSQSVLAHTRVGPHTINVIDQDMLNPVVDASIQAPNNIWYTGIGTTTNNYVLIGYWDGKTFRVPAGIPANSYVSSETGRVVISLSPTDTWVIANGPTDENPLEIFHFDGTSREIFPSPAVKGARVRAISAVNANDIWAVGSSGPHVHNFTMHWDGTSWQAVDAPDPQPSTDTNTLYSVDARTANDVWAVGTQRDPNGGDSPFALHWDGKTWSIKSSQNAVDLGKRFSMRSKIAFPVRLLNKPPIQTTGRLDDPPVLISAYYRAVAAVSADDVWVVGSGGGIRHWNGKQWRTIANPVDTATLTLNAISAYSGHDIWAVGRRMECTIFIGCNSVPFGEHWNGKTWCVVPIPPLSLPDGPGIGELIAVKMFTPNNVWAVGTSAGYVFLEHWDGHIWQVVAHRNLFDVL